MREYCIILFYVIVSSLSGVFAPPVSLPFCGGLPVFPGMPVIAPQHKAIPATSPAPPHPVPLAAFSGVFEFTQSEIDMLLYGYATPRSKSEAGLAISGLRLPNKTTGM